MRFAEVEENMFSVHHYYAFSNDYWFHLYVYINTHYFTQIILFVICYFTVLVRVSFFLIFCPYTKQKRHYTKFKFIAELFFFIMTCYQNGTDFFF